MVVLASPCKLRLSASPCGRPCGAATATSWASSYLENKGTVQMFLGESGGAFMSDIQIDRCSNYMYVCICICRAIYIFAFLFQPVFVINDRAHISMIS